MTPVAICMRKPQEPEAKLLSVTITIHEVGSVVFVGHALAYNVLPTTRNRKVYDVPAEAAKGTEPITVVAPLTFFCTTSEVPSR